MFASCVHFSRSVQSFGVTGNLLGLIPGKGCVFVCMLLSLTMSSTDMCLCRSRAHSDSSGQRGGQLVLRCAVANILTCCCSCLLFVSPHHARYNSTPSRTLCRSPDVCVWGRRQLPAQLQQPDGCVEACGPGAGSSQGAVQHYYYRKLALLCMQSMCLLVYSKCAGCVSINPVTVLPVQPPLKCVAMGMIGVKASAVHANVSTHYKLHTTNMHT